MVLCNKLTSYKLRLQNQLSDMMAVWKSYYYVIQLNQQVFEPVLCQEHKNKSRLGGNLLETESLKPALVAPQKYIIYAYLII